MNDVRAARQSTGLSQREFAQLIGVALETMRAWDSGRRQPPAAALAQISSIVSAYARGQSPEPPMDRRDSVSRLLAPAPDAAATRSDEAPLALPVLARVLNVSVFRLREAARDGRLAVTYGTRVAFGHAIPRATLAAGEVYKRQFYGKKARWVDRPGPPTLLATPPPDFDRQIAGLRRRLCLTQTQLARRIGAANKAVIYQWESRKRRPSPLLWRRVEALACEIALRRSERSSSARRVV